jgi:hypothetical protein
MPKTPWLQVSPPQSDRSCLALISYLPLRHFRVLPNFFLFSIQIQRQLRTAPGLIGYSMEAKLFARKFWTLSVWEDQQSLNDFVRKVPHLRIMQALAPHMGETKFAQWTVTHAEIPIDWQSAKARLGQT